MNAEKLIQYYNIQAQSAFSYEGRQVFYGNGYLYTVASVSHLSDEEVLELKYIGDHLHFQGEESIAVIIPNLNQELISDVEEQRFVVFAKRQTKNRYYISPGMQLASFHQRGKYYTYSINNRNRYGNWENYWVSRLEQLESWCHSRIAENSNSMFEKTFIETFPYYMGLAENAIQYIADSKRDNQNSHLDQVDQPTLCFIRYPYKLNPDTILFPDQLVYDHPTRDLAEWIRQWQQSDQNRKTLNDFLNDYERTHPLSVLSWKLLYGRLLFPLGYFECVEGYYRATSEEEKLYYEEAFMNYLERNQTDVDFLETFFDQIGLSIRKFHIPEVEWLKM